MYILGSVALVLVTAAGVWGYVLFNRYAPVSYVVEDATGTSTINSATGEVTSGSKTFTTADVATHKDATSCYSSINNSVYDLTMWINAHPGGKQAILSICGIDGTEKFMKKHKGGAKFMAILARFKIGTLTQ